MTSGPVELCNLALTNIGADNTIQSLAENSAEAQACNIVYKPSLREILATAAWRHALKVSAPLGDVTEADPPPTDWRFRYSPLPPDFIHPVELIIPTKAKNQPPIPFDFDTDVNGNNSMVADVDSAQLRYVFFQENFSTYPASFDAAFSWLIARNISFTLTRKPEVFTFADQKYEFFLARAKAYNKNIGTPPKRIDPSSIRARKGLS